MSILIWTFVSLNCFWSVKESSLAVEISNLSDLAVLLEAFILNLQRLIKKKFPFKWATLKQSVCISQKCLRLDTVM